MDWRISMRHSRERELRPIVLGAVKGPVKDLEIKVLTGA
jgi:hypothetical protein